VVDIPDVITCFKFGDDRFRGLASAEGQILPFPTDVSVILYLQHSHSLPCERVMATNEASASATDMTVNTQRLYKYLRTIQNRTKFCGVSVTSLSGMGSAADRYDDVDTSLVLLTSYVVLCVSAFDLQCL